MHIKKKVAKWQKKFGLRAGPIKMEFSEKSELLHFCVEHKFFPGGKQGDQIGRIFAIWALVYFGQFFLNYQSNQYFWLLFPTVKVMQ
jgi:hypothetical protein